MALRQICRESYSAADDTKRRVGSFAATASLVALSIGLGESTAFAQATAAQESETTDNPIIIVTGVTRQAADIQDVPTSITAFSGEALEQQGIDEVADIATFTPGFNTRAAGNNPTALNFSIRGQIQNDNIATLEPSVGVYLDDVYVARAYGINSELVDVRSVQVLKGPQGTLFGRNTSAGAVLIETNEPELSEASIALRGSYGRYDEFATTAVVNLGGEDIAVRGALYYGERDGYQRDVYTGTRYAGRETINGRARLLFQPADNVEIVLSGEWYDSDIDGPARQNLAFFLPDGMGGFVDPAAGDRALFGCTPGQPHSCDPDRVAVTPVATRAGAQGQFPFADLRNLVSTQTYNGQVRVDTDIGEIRLIAGYRQVDGQNIIDLDGSAFDGHFTQGFQDLEQFSMELQLAGTVASGLFDYVVGATYFSEDGFDISRSSTVGSPIWTGFNGMIDNESLGIYAQTSVHATDRLSITGGIRYSLDDKGVTAQSAVYPLNGDVPAVCLPTTFNIGIVLAGGALTPEDCNRPRADTFDNVSYTIGLDYKVTDDILIYAKQSRGYRSGAQQLRTLTLNDTTPADPEVVNEQEIGLKSQFWDRRVTFNIAGFHNTVSDAQRSVILNVGGTSQTILENADVENWGVEASLNVEVADGLSLFASGSLVDPTYETYEGFTVVGGVLTPIDKSGRRFVGIAEEQFTLGASYEADLSFGRFSANFTYAWQSEINQDDNTIASYMTGGLSQGQAQILLDATTSPSVGIANARAALSFGPEDNYEVAVWGRNIFDDRSPVYTLYLGGLNYVGAYYNDPATYGVSLTARFGN